MSEIKAMRLAQAATTYNVGTDHIVAELQKKGITVENKPTVKLLPEMVAILEQAFGSDKAIKAQAEGTKAVTEKPKKEVLELKTEIPVAPKREEEEKEVLIKTVKATPTKDASTGSVTTATEDSQKDSSKNEEQAAEVLEAKPTEKTGGLNVIGKIDLDAGKKKAAKKKEEPKEDVVVEKPAKKAEPKKVEETKPVVEEKQEEIVIHHETKLQKLDGPKILGKIEIKPEKKPDFKKPEPPKQDGEKRQRKRIEKPAGNRERVNISGNNNQGGGGYQGNRPFGDRNNNNRGGRFGDRNREQAPEQPTEITEKEIEEKIRATMAKIQAVTNKGNRVQHGRDKRKLHEERRLAENEAQQTGKLQVTEFISVADLASLMNIKPTEIIKTCMDLGMMVSINQRLDAEIIELICQDKGFEVEFISAQDAEVEEEVDAPETLQPRAPIVTIMGHVDHGKTSLLDYIRKANVVAKEAGGITQHIGAYEVTTASGKKITFLDTPGHEAFTAMRARGAKVTDIAVIVIAADDAIMPQTKEAINHAQSAGVPMIFAINKIDKEGAQPDKIREQLASMNLLVEEWGGKYQSQEISAKKGLNIDNLLDKILLEAEMLDLKANPNRLANGTVVEATLDKGRGYTTTILVQGGKLKMGDTIVAGPYQGKVKAMFDHTGKRTQFAGPSVPVQILGLSAAPQAGEKFKVYASEAEAKQAALKRAQIEREVGFRTKKHITLDEIGRRLALGNFKELCLIIKGDVDGSVEALADSLLKLSTNEIQVRIIHKGVGAISESDVLLAAASDAIVIGFNVRPNGQARKIAEEEAVEIKPYSIIYNAIEDIKSAMEGLLEPKIEEKVMGNIEVREVFNITKVGTIAGSYVKDGRVTRQAKVRVIRDGIVIHNGTLAALKRFKDDVKDVSAGMDCGIQLKDYQDIKVGDLIEAYEEIEIQRKL